MNERILPTLSASMLPSFRLVSVQVFADGAAVHVFLSRTLQSIASIISLPTNVSWFVKVYGWHILTNHVFILAHLAKIF